MQTLSTNERAVGASQENEAGSDFWRLTWTSHRWGELMLSLLIHGSWNKRSPDWTWTDCVNADTVLDLLVGETACESNDGSLGGSVVEQVRATNVVVYWGASDDGIATLHLWEDVLWEVEEWVNVGVESLDPLLPSSCQYTTFNMLRNGIRTRWDQQ